MKILVTYKSKTGFIKGYAEMIATEERLMGRKKLLKEFIVRKNVVSRQNSYENDNVYAK